jgi:murein DD-endopeptidase MepM/ murein hydrolase activator NlpD
VSWHLLLRAVATRLAERRLSKKAERNQQRRRIWPWVTVLAVAGVPAVTVVMLIVFAAAAVSGTTPALAGATAAGIPAVVFSAYLAAQSGASMVAEDCVVDWPVIAGIWKQESDHATIGGTTIDPDGQVTPPIYGPTLDGSIPGTQTIPDTDGGMLDGDPVWDRAVGPAQFLPTSWRTYGRDGNGDGIADPQNVYDAALSTVAYLCLRTPGDYHNPDHLTRALYGYNNSTRYVETVTEWITYYRAFTYTQGTLTADGVYAFPLPHGSATASQIRRTHHDYPASDLAVPEGTPVYAAHPGTVTTIQTPCDDISSCRCGWGVTITGHDQHRYTYCHAQTLADHLQPGRTVVAGELIMLSGNTGNSTTPHLHFQIRNPQGILVCPQTVLEAWWQGIGLSPAGAPTTGCTH